MKTQSILILLFLLIISCQTAKQDNEHTASCTFSDTLVIVQIPIIPQNNYTWFKKQMPDNVLEFKCDISFSQYRLGFYLYKFPGSKELKGSINQLFLSGQTSIWKKQGNSSSVVEGHGLSAYYIAPYVVMKITDASTIKLLFKDHPSSCLFSVIGFKAQKSDGIIEIQYK